MFRFRGRLKHCVQLLVFTQLMLNSVRVGLCKESSDLEDKQITKLLMERLKDDVTADSIASQILQALDAGEYSTRKDFPALDSHLAPDEFISKSAEAVLASKTLTKPPSHGQKRKSRKKKPTRKDAAAMSLYDLVDSEMAEEGSLLPMKRSIDQAQRRLGWGGWGHLIIRHHVLPHVFGHHGPHQFYVRKRNKFYRLKHLFLTTLKILRPVIISKVLLKKQLIRAKVRILRRLSVLLKSAQLLYVIKELGYKWFEQPKVVVVKGTDHHYHHGHDHHHGWGGWQNSAGSAPEQTWAPPPGPPHQPEHTWGSPPAAGPDQNWGQPPPSAHEQNWGPPPPPPEHNWGHPPPSDQATQQQFHYQQQYEQPPEGFQFPPPHPPPHGGQGEQILGSPPLNEYNYEYAPASPPPPPPPQDDTTPSPPPQLDSPASLPYMVNYSEDESQQQSS